MSPVRIVVSAARRGREDVGGGWWSVLEHGHCLNLKEMSDDGRERMGSTIYGSQIFEI